MINIGHKLPWSCFVCDGIWLDWGKIGLEWDKLEAESMGQLGHRRSIPLHYLRASDNWDIGTPFPSIIYLYILTQDYILKGHYLELLNI